MADLKKTMTFATRVDTTEFDRTVDLLQRKIKDIYRGADTARLQFENRVRMSQIGMGPQVTPQERRITEIADVRARNEYRLFIKEQARDNTEINKQIVEKIKLLETAKKLNQDTSKIEQQIAQLAGQRAGKEEAIKRTLEQAEIIRQRQIDPSRIMNRLWEGDKRGAKRAAKIAFGRMTGAEISTMFGGAIVGAGEMAAIAGQTPAQVLENRALAAQFNNEQLRRAFAGQRYEDIYYKKEMGQAGTVAGAKVGGMAIRDIAIALAGLVAMGAATVGTAGGALAFLGGLGAAGFGAYKLGMGTLGGGYSAEYQQSRRKAYEELKELDFFKKYAMEDLQKNMYSNLQTQRALGLGDEQLRQAYVAGSQAGFVKENIRGAMMEILGAGGSTRGVRELASTALGFQRDYGITNASQLLGRLSGTVGGAAESEQSMIKILSEGTRIGLGKSELRQELRTFSENVADLAYRVGATGPERVGALSAMSGAFVADTTPRGLEAAKNAQEALRQREISQSGLKAAVEAGEMMSDPGLSKLDTSQMLRLQGMSATQIASLSGPELEAMLDKTGLSEEEFKKRMASAKVSAITAGAPGAKQELYDFQKKTKGKSYKDIMSDPQLRIQAGHLQSMFGGQILPAGMETPEVQSFTQGIVTREAAVADYYQTQGVEEYRKRVRGKGRAPELDQYASPMPEVSPETLADKQERAAAAQQLSALELQKLFGEDFKNSVDDARIAAVKFATALTEAADMIRKGDPEGQKRMNWMMENPQADPEAYRRQQQPQATTPQEYYSTDR